MRRSRRRLPPGLGEIHVPVNKPVVILLTSKDVIHSFKVIAMRVTSGAISLSNPSHLPPIPSSKLVNPVMLPPGFAKLSTKPLPTGSAIIGDTIGTVRVCFSSALISGVL